MQAVWLVSNGSPVVSQDKTEGPAGRRHKFLTSTVEKSLSNQQSFKERFEGSQAAQSQMACLSSHPQLCVVVGLAWICGGQHITSCLQEWGTEETALIKAHQFKSLFFLEARQVVGVNLKQANATCCVVRHWQRAGQTDGRYKIFEINPDAVASWWDLPSLQGETIGSAAASVVSSQDAETLRGNVKVAVVVCPDSIVSLVTCNLWSKIPFLEVARAEGISQSAWVDRWRHRREHVLPVYDELFPRGRPSEQTTVVNFVNRVKGWDELHDRTALKPTFFDSLALNLQRWAPAILSSHAADEGPLQDSIEALMDASFSLSAEGISQDLMAFGHGYSCGKKRNQYAAWAMLKTVLLCDNLKDARKLRETILHAGALCFLALASQLEEVFADRSVPSASTISRHRYFVDVAFMRFMREQHSERFQSSKALQSRDAVLSELINVGSFHYLMTDASPQGGQEWQLSQASSIPVSGLQAVGKAVFQLRAMRFAGVAGETDLTDTHADKLKKQECSNVIQKHVEEHVFPVAGLGKAGLSLRQKVHSLLHQIKLEVETMEEFVEYLSSTVSITTDQGTEVGIAELPSLDLSQFSPLAQEIDIECWEESEANPDPTLDNMEITIDEGDNGDSAHHGPARPGVGPAPAAGAVVAHRAGSNLPPGHYLWPFTLVVVGMCHICHNACEELCVQMPCRGKLVDQVRPLASFLHSRSSRQRLEEKCLRDSSEANKVFKTQLQGKFHSLYTARWGSMTTVLEEILSVRTLFLTAWDPKAYCDGTSESDALKAQLAAISEAVGEPLFWARCHMLLHLAAAMEHFSKWCEGCPCHSLPPTSSRWKRQRFFMKEAGHSFSDGSLEACALKGARAAELACGDHKVLLANLLEQGCLDMLESLPVALVPEEWALLETMG